MAVCYNKLWKLLIDRGLNKTQLCKEANITTNAMARLGRNEDVRVDDELRGVRHAAYPLKYSSNVFALRPVSRNASRYVMRRVWVAAKTASPKTRPTRYALVR